MKREECYHTSSEGTQELAIVMQLVHTVCSIHIHLMFGVRIVYFIIFAIFTGLVSG